MVLRRTGPRSPRDQGGKAGPVRVALSFSLGIGPDSGAAASSRGPQVRVVIAGESEIRHGLR